MNFCFIHKNDQLQSKQSLFDRQTIDAFWRPCLEDCISLTYKSILGYLRQILLSISCHLSITEAILKLAYELTVQNMNVKYG